MTLLIGPPIEVIEGLTLRRCDRRLSHIRQQAANALAVSADEGHSDTEHRGSLVAVAGGVDRVDAEGVGAGTQLGVERRVTAAVRLRVQLALEAGALARGEAEDDRGGAAR